MQQNFLNAIFTFLAELIALHYSLDLMFLWPAIPRQFENDFQKNVLRFLSLGYNRDRNVMAIHVMPL